MSATAALLQLEGLRVWFPTRGTPWAAGLPVRAVDGVDLAVGSGETFGIVGESGCGKTTIAKAILKLVPVTAGRILLKGEDITALSERQFRPHRRQIQLIFQDPYASLNPRLSLAEIVRAPLDIHRVGSTASRRERVKELLQLVGLGGASPNRRPHEFSGGQRQRIGLARALALSPELLVADEPTSALDVSIRAQIINLMSDLQEQLGLTYLYISHDLAVMRQIANHIAVMYLGQVVESGPTRDLFAQPAHPYTVALLSAVPVPDPEAEAGRRRLVLVGEVPSPSNPPPGCRFHTRCWLRTTLGNPERCSAETPPLITLPGRPDHRVACHFSDEIAGGVESPAPAALANRAERLPEGEPPISVTGQSARRRKVSD